MKKNFVFDTNVLLTDPHALYKFGDNNVVVPITVIEELDNFKHDNNTLGRNAREVTRIIDSHRGHGNLSKGVLLEGGGTLRVLTNLGQEPPLPFPTLNKTADGLILASALTLKKKEDLPVILVTRDTNLRLRADAVGLSSETYKEEVTVQIEELYSGHARIEVTTDQIYTLRTQGVYTPQGQTLAPNQCVTFVDPADPDNVILGRYHADEGLVRTLSDASRSDVWGIQARNTEQRHTLDLLLDDSIRLVTLVGKAGTGKTLLAIAAGVQKALGEHVFRKLVVARPIVPLGKDLGYLPGAMGDKLQPWMEPVYDNLELILLAKENYVHEESQEVGADKKKRSKRATTDEIVRRFKASGILDVQPLTYIRGRSLPHQYLIIDEAQNLTHHEVKTIITRAGEGTKIVLTGDPYQIDNPFLDSSTSGLTIAVERFKGQSLAGHMTLFRGERSPLAELASDIL
ncbi:MAG TPA: PhoH family protein [Candidatus Sumerlaeota bacterium]|nr:PhoH family protein [Candidatus Sumerlaeota bacterium]